MANRRPQQNAGRRVDFGRNDRNKNFGRSGVSPWQGGGPGGGGLPNLLPLAGGSTEATLALASNIINLLQPRQNPVPSLLDMPIRRDFGPNTVRFDRGFIPNRMGNQNFRRTGNYNRSGERVNNNRKPFRPNDGQRQQNKSSPKKEPDSKPKPKESEGEVKKEEETEQTEQKEATDDKSSPKTRYDDITPQLLKCHICNKSMWDGRSFENHLSGRAHAIMMQKTAESYALTADTMRQEFKIREMKRTRKTGSQPPRDFYCAMCDMYAADGAIHRTTVGHRKLKKYLHPSCTCCHKEMPTRIELDEHRLTAEHLRNMQDKQEVISKPKPEVMVISTLSMEQSYLRDERSRRRRDPGRRQNRDADKDADKDTEKDGDKDGDVTMQDVEGEVKKETEDGVEVKQEVEEKKPIDQENTVLDYTEGDDLTGVVPEQFPVYSMERGVGRAFLEPFSCVQCKLCHKLLDTEETAEVHLKTWRHHQLFVRLLNEKTGSLRTNNEQHNEKQNEQQMLTQERNKRPMNDDDSGTWKRRKTNPDEENDDDNENGHEEADTDINEEQTGEGDGDNLAYGETDGDNTLPPPEDLEDWEQSVDEILQDETEPQEDEPQEKPQEDPKPEPEPEPAPAPPPARAPAPALNTPRGRGRGRGRRY